MKKSGKSSWNKGIPRSEETKRKISEGNKGKKLSAETKQKISDSWLDEDKRKQRIERIIAGNKGKKLSKEGLENVTRANRIKNQDPIVRKKISKANKGRPKSEAHKAKIAEAHRGKKRPPFSKEWRQNLLEAHRKMWQNPEFVRKMFKRFALRPTRPELELLNILKVLLPNEYKYVGDGQFILGGKCPDFLNVNGKKKLIELYGDYWHRGQDPQDRIDYFKQFGFDCLVIWQHELKRPEFVKVRILKFNNME